MAAGADAGRSPLPRVGHGCGFGYVEPLMTSDAALTMYTTTWCGYCVRLKVALKAAGIGYTEVNIERDPAAAEFVMSVNGGNQTVPTVKLRRRFDADQSQRARGQGQTGLISRRGPRTR